MSYGKKKQEVTKVVSLYTDMYPTKRICMLYKSLPAFAYSEPDPCKEKFILELLSMDNLSSLLFA